MAGLNADALQNVINTTMADNQYVEAFQLERSFLNWAGGLQAKHKGQWYLPFYTAGNVSASFFAEGDTLTAGRTSRDRVLVPIKRVKNVFSLDGLVEARAQGLGYNAISDLVMDEMEISIKEMFNVMNTKCVTSGSSTEINAIPDQIASASGAYFGKARASNVWANAYQTAASAPLSMSMLDTAYQDLLDNRAAAPDAILTSFNVAKQYRNLLRTDGNLYDVQGIGDVAFSGLEYENIPIYVIPGYDNRWDFVNRSDISVWYLPQVSRDEVGRTITGPFKVEQLAKTSDDTTWALIAYVNLVIRNPFKTGAVTAITSI